MRKLLLAVILLFAALLAPTGAVARGTRGSERRRHGDVRRRPPGLAIRDERVIFRGGSVQGQFNCVMAGRSAFADLRLMKVDGRITAGLVDVAAGTATSRRRCT